MSDDIQKRVTEMARLTVLTNTINPIQQKNMETYPFIFFDGIESVKIEFNLSSRPTVEVEEDVEAIEATYKFNKDIVGCHVDYFLSGKQEQNNTDYRLKHLEQAIRDLFWDNIKVRVFLNEKLLSESE